MAGVKRKAQDGVASRSKRKEKTASPILDFGDEEQEDDTAVTDIYADPMIDRQGSDDSEEEEGLELEDDEPIAGPSRTSTKSLYKPPTLEELDTLREAEATGGTNFSLQLDALLSSTLMSTTPHPALKSLLSSLHSHILSLPALEGVSPKKAVKRLRGVDIPFVGPREFSPLAGEDVKWTLGWDKPEEIFVGGSWSVAGGYKKGKGEMGGIDLMVIMPSALLSPKDRMSYRYFDKRSHYLAVIKAALHMLASKSDSPLHASDITWTTTGGDARRPAICVSAGKQQGLKHAVDIIIHAGIPSSVFPASTLQPSKSLLRHASIPADSSTPLYATSILHDTLHKAHLLNLNRLSQSMTTSRVVDSFLALWRIWTTRRGLNRQRGGSGWFAAMLLSWVVDGGEVGGSGGVRDKAKRVRGLGKSLSHWSAIRGAWEFLAHTDFAKTPVFVGAADESNIPRSEILNAFDQVLVDPTGTINVFAGWEQGDIQMLQHHARQTLAMLEDSSVDRFADVFLRDQSLGSAVYDDFTRVDILTCEWSPDILRSSEYPSRSGLLASSVASILRRGLSDRAEIVHVSATSDDTLGIGIIYNPSNATRLLDIGPSSEQTEASAGFRQLWGDKSDLRRFKDGSITETVVWDLTRPEDATLIPSRIIRYLLAHHFAIAEDQVESLTSSQSWLQIVQTPASARESVAVASSERLGFRPIMDAYDDLYKLLKSIDSELPLAILQVQPASELLRYSSTFVPHPVDFDRLASSPDCLKWIPHADLILQFESSPRWPDDLAAIQKVKLAMFEKLSQVIVTHRRGAKANVVFDAGRSDIEDSASLEVVVPAGIAFRIRIYHERERTLLERVLEDDTPTFGTSLPLPPRRLAIPAFDLHLRQFVHLPQHHSSIAPMHHKFNSYSSATRLLKRWFSAHMLSLLVPHEVIELIMAKVYLDPASLHPPSSGTSGFVRAITLLSEWDWKAGPLVVPVFSAPSATGRIRLPEATRSEISKSFEDRRSKDKDCHQAWIIPTEQDFAGTRWTGGIGRVVAGRVRSLAKATLSAIRVAATDGDLQVKALFATPTSDYNVLIHLKPAFLTRYAQAVSPDASEWEEKIKFRNVQTGVFGAEARISFDPAATFARDIQRLYGDSVLVFYDQLGGSVIGLLWDPTRFTPRALKPFLGYSSRPSGGEAALVELDRSAIIGEISRIGSGLVDRVQVL